MFLVPVVRTCQKAGVSAKSSRNYEKIPLMRKPLLYFTAQPNGGKAAIQSFLLNTKHNTNLIEFVGEGGYTGPELLDAINDDCTDGRSSEGLVIDYIDFLREHVQKQSSAQHIRPCNQKRTPLLQTDPCIKGTGSHTHAVNRKEYLHSSKEEISSELQHSTQSHKGGNEADNPTCHTSLGVQQCEELLWEDAMSDLSSFLGQRRYWCKTLGGLMKGTRGLYQAGG